LSQIAQSRGTKKEMMGIDENCPFGNETGKRAIDLPEESRSVSEWKGLLRDNPY